VELQRPELIEKRIYSHIRESEWDFVKQKNKWDLNESEEAFEICLESENKKSKFAFSPRISKLYWKQYRLFFFSALSSSLKKNISSDTNSNLEVYHIVVQMIEEMKKRNQSNEVGFISNVPADFKRIEGNCYLDLQEKAKGKTSQKKGNFIAFFLLK
jgi:hypothetical protein